MLTKSSTQYRKANAGRLVMTESAYFAAEAQKDAFRTLDVEEFEIVGTLDSKTCPLCVSFDGEHMPMAQYEAGVTASPFHPWCRCCTAPFSDDMDGERFACDPESDEGYYVPADMKYEEWKEKSVDGGDKAGIFVSKRRVWEAAPYKGRCRFFPFLSIFAKCES